jgi:RNA recognition motif-containing protein
MAVRLFVGNLAYDVTEAELREFMSAAGAPVSVRILTDRETGRPRGFAFVEYGDSAQADEAVRRFNQQVFKGRPLVVNEARPREAGPGPRPGGPGPRMGGPAPSGWPASAPAGDSAPGARRGEPTRNFGPDAPPRGTRKPKARSRKGEPRAPKKPIPERSGGQFFGGAVEDLEDGPEDVAFWARDAENQDSE